MEATIWYKKEEARRDFRPPSDEEMQELERWLAAMERKHGPPTSTRLDARPATNCNGQARPPHCGHWERQDYHDERAEEML